MFVLPFSHVAHIPIHVSLKDPRKISKIVLLRFKEKLVWTKMDLDWKVPTKHIKKSITIILQKNDCVYTNKSTGIFPRIFL